MTLTASLHVTDPDPMPQTGENFDPSALFDNRGLDLRRRARYINRLMDSDRATDRMPFHREIRSPMDREVLVSDRSGTPRPVLMFGSNNYLGLANHPVVRARVERAMNDYGTGIGGPPFLNGYLGIMRELEERLAHHKGQEDAVVFSSGYGANLALPAALARPGDSIYYDNYSHASWFDGLKLAGLPATRFPHNDLDALDLLLAQTETQGTDVFVAVEGVYSMEGDLAPLDRIVPTCHRRGALVVVDDAHGTGVMGDTGCGTGEHFGVASDIDVVMGTFSKTLAVNGGFIAASASLVEYLRWVSRSYMFSAAMPPTTTAAVHGALDVIEAEPERMTQLHDNVAYVCAQLNGLRWGFAETTPSAIIALRTPSTMDAKAACMRMDQLGVFVNPVHYPAVPRGEERMRISIMSTHTRDDLDRLVATIDRVWSEHERGDLAQPVLTD